MRVRLALAASFVPLVLLAACRSSTSTNAGPPPTHPSGNTATRILGLGGRPFAVRVARTGDVLVTEQDLNAAVHLDSLGTRRDTIGVGHDPGDVVADRAGTRAFVSNFFDGTVSVVDLTSKAVATVVRVSPSNAYRLALNGDESRLYVTSTDGHLYTINTGSQTAGVSAALSGSLQGIALARAGQSVFVTSTGGTIWRLDAASLATAKSATLGCAAQDIGLSTDDAELYVACENGSVLVVDPTTLATKTTITVSGAAPFGLAVAPDNAQLYVSSPTTGVVAIIDRAGRTVLKSLPVSGVPRRVTFNAHGNKAYVANEQNWIDVIE